MANKKTDETRQPREAQTREKTSRADEYPDFEYPALDTGKYDGVIGVGGLILCRIPRETVDERSQYFNAKTRDQILAVDNDLMKEQNPAMPINSNRQSRVTFGGNRED